jgi:heat shock protein HslJ
MASKNRQRLIVTIKDGQMDVDSQGFVGMECADDALNRELKSLGKLQGGIKQKGDRRPVHDVGVIDVGH